MSTKLKVNVSFSAQVTWSAEVEMTPDEYAAYISRLDAAEEEGRREVRELHEELFDELGFDRANPADWDDMEMDDFMLIEPEATTK